MAGERRKRQQRVRHEAGGSTGQAADGHPHTDTPSSAVGGGEPSSTASSSNAPTTSAAVMARPAKQAAGGSAGRGRGGAKPGGGRRGGVAVATVDEKLHYQPVTIMESKGATPVDELDEAPRQYRRRGIVSNWSRYEERNPALDELEDGRDYLIGEDFSAVLQQQSQGSGGGGHLRLRGEETWGFGDVGSAFRQEGGQQHGLGALRVTDLANTIATIPFMEQLGLDDNRLPKQLAEHYNQLAEDNRRLYNPSEDPANVADTAELLEEQLQRLRLAFFDSSSSATSSTSGVCPPVSKDVSRKNQTRASNAASKEAGSDQKLIGERTNQGEFRSKGATIEDFDDSFASSVDFNSLEKDLNEEISQEPSSEMKVDLTEKMCRAFGSDINEVGDDFGGFEVDVEGEFTQESRDATFAFAVAQSNLDKLPLRDGNVTVKSSANVSINGTNPIHLPFESKSKVNNSGYKQDVSTQPAQDDVPLTVPCKELSPELDFSSGNPSFSFGLPKPDKGSRNLMSSLSNNLQTASKTVQSKKEEDIDIFTPSKDKNKAPIMSVKDQSVIDLDAPIVPVPVSLVNTKEDTKELEDWLDSVLDD